MTGLSNTELLDGVSLGASSATSAAVLFTTDTTGFNSISFQLTANPSGASVVVLETSNDNVNWSTVSAQYSGTVGASNADLTTSITFVGLYIAPVVGKWMRARVSIYGSGTVTATGMLRSQEAPRAAAVLAAPLDATLLGPYSVGSATNLFSQDTIGYNSVSVQVTSAGTGCTVSYEVSNDNSTWVAVGGSAVASFGSTVTTTTTAGVWYFPVTARYFRARVSTYGSGTVTVVAALRSGFGDMMGTVGITGSVSALVGATNSSNSTSKVRMVAAGTTNLTAVKSSAGRVMSIVADNAAAYDVFLKLYNIVSGSVTVGTSSITYTLRLKAGTTTVFNAADFGFYFSTAISFAVTKLVGDSDTTVLVANDCIVQVDYV